MPDKKTVFIAFAIEDESARNLFVGQRINSLSPFEFIDLSVSDAYEIGWKAKVTSRIRRSDGVIVLVSRSTPNAEGQLWEIATAVAEGRPILGIWIEDGYRIRPEEIGNAPIKEWAWNAIADFIDSI